MGSTFYAFHWDGEAKKTLSPFDFDGMICATMDQVKAALRSRDYFYKEIKDFDPESLFDDDYQEAVFMAIFGEGLPDGYDTLVLLSTMPDTDDHEEILRILLKARMFVENQELDFSV